MRRIYIESILGVICCFFLSLFLYEVTVYQLSTDYEFVLKDYEAEANQQLFENIALHQGTNAAHKAISQFATTSRNTFTIFNPSDNIPEDVKDNFTHHPEKKIYYDEDRTLWFRLAKDKNIYSISSDEQAFVRQKVELEDNLAFVFILSSFIVYGFGHLFIIFRRVKTLEDATLHFADGDFSSRVQASTGKSLGTLNRSFNHMADKISELIKSNKSLTNAVAHELRTPIFKIQWQAEVLKETELDEEQYHSVNSIVEDTEEMEKMVDELLDYARLELNSITLHPEKIEVDDWLTQSVIRWQNESPLRVTTSLSSSPTSLYLDRRLVDRALDNLVRNAFKYARHEVRIIVKQENNQTLIQVHDDGPGVDKEHWPQLFEPFYVGNAARNKSKSGYGLGLSIVKRICDQHEATVKVGRSEQLGGALFEIAFPNM